MSKNQKIFTGIIVIAVLGYAVYTLKDKIFNFSGGNEEEYNSDYNMNKDEKKSNNTETEVIEENNGDSENGDEESQSQPVFETEEDEICYNECKEQVGDERNNCLIKCRDRLEKEKLENTECDNLNETQEYECFRKKAIKEKNQSICDNISNESNKQKCINAVIETIIDGM